MSKKSHPWSKGFPKVVNRKMKKPRGDIEAVYQHRIEPNEPVSHDSNIDHRRSSAAGGQDE